VQPIPPLFELGNVDYCQTDIATSETVNDGSDVLVV
jgi:hypothetical protein